MRRISVQVPPSPSVQAACFVEDAKIATQTREPEGFKGKVVLTKGLAGALGARTGVMTERWAKNRERTGPVTGQSTSVCVRGWGRPIALPHPSVESVGGAGGPRQGYRSRLSVMPKTVIGGQVGGCGLG